MLPRRSIVPTAVCWAMLASGCWFSDESPSTEADAGIGDATSNDCGTPCGECNAGRMDCSTDPPQCAYPSQVITDALLRTGMEPVDVGDMPTFDPDNYSGTDVQRLGAACAAAQSAGGAVVMRRVYELDRDWRACEQVTYTGGGLRRACTPSATVTRAASANETCVAVNQVEGFVLRLGYAFAVDATYEGFLGRVAFDSIDATRKELCTNGTLGFDIPQNAAVFFVSDLVLPPRTVGHGMIFDSVLFDGNFRCNPYTHSWLYNSTLAIRGANTVRNSIFYDTPSENITHCGARILKNIAYNLQGSFTHKSCSPVDAAMDVLANNYVENTNLAGNEASHHSEGLITFSANAGDMSLNGNVFRHGREGVYGLASSDDKNVEAVNDCYAHFPRLIRFLDAASHPETFYFDVTLIDVGDDP